MNDPIAFFAVKEEAAFVDAKRLRSLVTGMGAQNASEKAASMLTLWNPSHVFTCGFAGGLDPELKFGTVVCSLDEKGTPFADVLRSMSVREVAFHCADNVAVTKEDKALLRKQTEADAVEMESSHIQMVCRERGVRCDVIRVISDAANEDLPLNFAEMMTTDYRMRWGKLFFHLAIHPSAVPRLMRFQKQLKQAANNLGDVLNQLVAA